MVDQMAGDQVLSRAGRRRPVVIGAAAVAAALLAGCGSTQPGAALPPAAGGQLPSALRAWAGFPAGRSPRPLVLLGPGVADPPSGFPDGAVKLAYLERAIDTPATLPAGTPAADGFPLIGARQAWRAFSSGAAKGPPAGVRLAVTRIWLGSGVFPTDRGPRRLPAWLFGLRQVAAPAAVLAVAPARIFTPPDRLAENSSGVGTTARLGPDGRTLTVRFIGAPAGTGPCTADYQLQVAASAVAVAFALRERFHGSATTACALPGFWRQVTTTLPAPLAGRVLVDASSGTAVAVTKALPGG